jgi:uncharacterized protein YjbJ (UPF0337 family)
MNPTPGGRNETTHLEEGADMAGEDKAKNKAQELRGQAKEVTGRATDDEQLESEGRSDRSKGSAKQAGEKAKDAIKGALGKQ